MKHAVTFPVSDDSSTERVVGVSNFRNTRFGAHRGYWHCPHKRMHRTPGGAARCFGRALRRTTRRQWPHWRKTLRDWNTSR